MKIGIIGAGKMGEMIILGLRQGKESRVWDIQATTDASGDAKEIESRLSIECHRDNLKLASSSDVIILCVKPHQAEPILTSIQSALNSNNLLISICASITTRRLRQWGGENIPIVRAMPNTPCSIGEGMTVLCGDATLPYEKLRIAEAIFGTLGKTTVIEESLMDGATGLSGCGPAYVYLMIEALSEAGVKIGLPRKVATLLAAQTLSGAAQMTLRRDIHPAALKDEVTTPAGCTIDGLMALEEGKLRVTLIKAVVAAAEKSKLLSN
jgi:pyrroline-5-carboxylate reductase